MDLGSFAGLVAETLRSSNGWSRGGYSFSQVDTGGDMTVWLSEASLMPTFGGVCDSDWSCRSGRNVVINNDRWMNASAAWNAGGGGLRDYRHMVVNHEVGHALGFPHAYCSAAGQLAPVMQQQSINLMGCNFNPWPLDWEVRR